MNAIDPKADRTHPAVQAQEAARERLRNGKPLVDLQSKSTPEVEDVDQQIPEPPPAVVQLVEPRPLVEAPKPIAKATTLGDFDFEQVLKFVFSKMKPEQVFERMVSSSGKEETIILHGVDMDLNWNVLLFTATDTTVSFFVNRKASHPNLKMATGYAITRGHERYDLKFVAGFYPSQDFGYGIMSFLRIAPNE